MSSAVGLSLVISFTLSQSGAFGQVITTVAGGGWRPFPSPVPAIGAPLGAPSSPALDGQGNLYFSDGYSNVVLKLSAAGILTVVAGNGNAGYSGDGGPATSASLNSPAGVSLDAAGNLYIADSDNNCIRKVASGMITTVAGTGVVGFSGDGGPAVSARLQSPSSVALDSAGNLYIADNDNGRVREVSGGTIKTVAGNGSLSFSGDGGPATQASLRPSAVAVDGSGNLYIADATNERVREVSGGIIVTIAGNGVDGFSGDGGRATAASLNFPTGLALDAAGNLFIADYFNCRVRKVSGGTITTVAGNGAPVFSGDGGPAIAAGLDNPQGVAVDAGGQLYIADYSNERIRKVSGGVITTVAGGGQGTFFGDDGPATGAGLFNPQGIAFDAAGNYYIADSLNNRVRKVSGGIATTVAGTGAAGFSGDGGPATSAMLNEPTGVALDAQGNLYIADSTNQRIRRVSGGIITTVAGGGGSGDGGPATSAALAFPLGIALDAAGNLYIADSAGNRVHEVSDGIITAVAGTGAAGFSGDGGPATSAMLNWPRGMAFDGAGSLYIADSFNSRIRKVTNGVIATAAGNGAQGAAGDGGPAIAAALNTPTDVTIDGAGNLFITDTDNSRIRKVSGGTISTIAGSGPGNAFSGDGGPATQATLLQPGGLAFDLSGNPYISDSGHNRIREVLAVQPSYQATPVALTFAASAGGSAPAAQTISLSSMVPGLGFTAAPSFSWLSVTPSGGPIPASLQVSVDPSSLSPGTYQGTIAISAPLASPSSAIVAVSFTVAAGAPAQLGVSPQNLAFTAVQGGAAQIAHMQVSNSGGAPLMFTAAASTTTGGTWLSVSQASGTATSAIPATLTVTADPSLLTAGTYRGAIAITGAGTTANIAVTLSVSVTAASILLSQSGLSFFGITQGGSPLPQSFGILNTGQGPMNWTAAASILSGGNNWLTISPASGTVVQPYLDVSTVNVSVNPANLAAGTYYGRIQVSASAVNSPQVLTVILTVLPAGSTLGPEVRPSGLIFTGAAGASPSSQNVTIGNPKATADNYLSASIGNAFTYLPTSADVPPNQPVTLSVFPNFSQLQPGEIDRGTITLQFSDGTPRNVGILTVVAPSATSASRVGGGFGLLTSANCSKPKLEIQWRSPMPNFTAVVGQPTTLEAQVVDDCGDLIGPNDPQSASVNTAFTNNDAGIKLTHIGNGIWTGTWRPVNSAAGQVSVTATAFNSTGTVLQSGQQSITGSLSSAATPVVTAGGVVHAASDAAGVPIAPGSLITIYGSNLSDATGESSTLPLPQQENGTQVLLGNLLLPILYTSSGQINVQVPFDTPVNTQYQISVQRDNVLSVPEQLVVAAAQPGIFTVNEQGTGQAVIFKSDGVTLADAGTPADQGETVVMYCTGLGAVNPAIPDGTPAPALPLSNTVDPVMVTIGGQRATVSFSGLTPGFPGLYQINAVVPMGVSGDAVQVVVSVAGQTSPAVTMAVQE